MDQLFHYSTCEAEIPASINLKLYKLRDVFLTHF